MNLQIFTREKTFINLSLAFVSLVLFGETLFAGWEIDLSRRRRDIQKNEETTGVKKDNAEIATVNALEKFAPAATNTTEIVILNTAKGFVPHAIQLKKGETYTIHVVNVNEKEKNTSFIMDSFKEHHATYFGQIKTFSIKPDKEGVFTYQCPETSIEGRVVIYKTDDSNDQRDVASDKSED